MTNYGPDDHGYVDVIRTQYARTIITLDDSIMDLLTNFLFDKGDPNGPLFDLMNGLAVAQEEMHEVY